MTQDKESQLISQEDYANAYIEQLIFLKYIDPLPYSLTVPTDEVEEIKLPKPSGEVFWNDLI